MARDMVCRGRSSPSPLGTSLFILLRALDPLLQYYLLVSPPSFLHLTPQAIHLREFLILFMVTGASLKHIYWLLRISKEEMPVSNAMTIGIVYAIFNAFNTLLSLTNISTYFTPKLLTKSLSPHQNISILFLLGSLLYLIGLCSETISEIQRKNFKDKKENQGKVYTKGLFGLARHVNYGSSVVWRVGAALSTGGWIWGVGIGMFHGGDFVRRGVPVLDEYCEKRYGKQWDEYKKGTVWKLIPWVY